MNNEVLTTIFEQAGIAGFALLLCYFIFKAIIGKVVFTNLTPDQSSKIVLRIIYIFSFMAVLFLCKNFYEDITKQSENKPQSQIKLNKNSVPFFSTTDIQGDLSDTVIAKKFNDFILDNQGEVVKLDVAINTIDTNIKLNFSDEDMKESPYFILIEDEDFEYRYVIERNDELYNIRTFDSGFCYITGYFAVGNQTVPHHRYAIGDGMATIISLRPIPAEKIIK